MEKRVDKRLRLQVARGFLEARVLGIHSVLALHLFGVCLFLVVFEQCLYLVLEPVTKVIEVVVIE